MRASNFQRAAAAPQFHLSHRSILHACDASAAISTFTCDAEKPAHVMCNFGRLDQCVCQRTSVRVDHGCRAHGDMLHHNATCMRHASSSCGHARANAGRRRRHDTQIINEAYFAEATQPSQNINPAYGYFWWLNGQESFLLPGIPLEGSGSLISSGPDDMVMALGTDDQKIYVVPSSNMIVIRMGESGDDPNLALSPFDVELWERLSALTQ